MPLRFSKGSSILASFHNGCPYGTASFIELLETLKSHTNAFRGRSAATYPLLQTTTHNVSTSAHSKSCPSTLTTARPPEATRPPK